MCHRAAASRTALIVAAALLLVGATASAAPPDTGGTTTPTTAVAVTDPGPLPIVAAAAPCTPRQLTGVVDSLTLSQSTVGAWATIQANFSGHLPDGGCAGDFFTIVIPSGLAIQSGTFPVTAPDGSVIGQMAVDETTSLATVTFNSYIETHTSVKFSGFLSASLTEQYEPGHSYNLAWNVAGEATTTPITVDVCPTCQTPRTWASKWAVYSSGRILSGLESAATTAAGEVVTFTDSVDAGQAIRCGDVSGYSAHSLNSSGGLVNDGAWPVTLVSCTTTKLVATMVASGPGQYLGLTVYADVTAPRTSYTDHGTVEQAGVTNPVEATAVVFGGGVVGSGLPTTTTTTTSTTTTTPATTSTTSTTVAPVTTVVIVEAPTTAPRVAAPRSSSLPVTGSGGDGLVAMGIAFAALGALALLAARRPTRRPRIG